jgi:nucleoid-associated protein YgaU
MVRVRITHDSPEPKRSKPRPPKRSESKAASKPPVNGKRGLSERQWFTGLLVASGLLMLFTFRGCILPSGIGPKSPPAAKVSPQATPSTAPAAGGEYTVQSGDTLSEIASKTGTTVEALTEANDITTSTVLRAGQKLKVPQQ